MNNRNPRTLDKLCKSYLSKVVPAEANIVQVTETRQAFMSGAMILLKAITNMPDDDNEALEMMNFLQEEIDAFSVEMGVKL